MTDKRKDEIKAALEAANELRFHVVICSTKMLPTEADERYEKIRKVLENCANNPPPVPDDVADDIKHTRELWERTNNKIPDYMERIIRAASTPDAGLVPDKYHRHHEIHEGNCITCYAMQGEINHLHRRLDSRDQVDAAECAGLRGEIDKLREVLERIAVNRQAGLNDDGFDCYTAGRADGWNRAATIAQKALRETEEK